MSRKERYACGNQKVLRSFKLYKMDLQKHLSVLRMQSLELKCDIKPVAKSVQQSSLEVKPGTQICKKASGYIACWPCPISPHNLIVCEFHKRFILLC